MERLTEKDVCGNWSLKGLPWKDLYEGHPLHEKPMRFCMGRSVSS